jgi:hypothetical protein
MHSKDANVQELVADWRQITRKYNDLSGAYITLEQEVIRLRHENEFMIRFLERQLNKEADDGVLHSHGARMP